jgi:hypothetical protein
MLSLTLTENQKERILFFTNPIVRLGGGISFAVYVSQSWNLIQHPAAAIGILVIAFVGLILLQIATVLNCIAKDNWALAQGMAVSSLGVLSFIITTIILRVFYL